MVLRLSFHSLCQDALSDFHPNTHLLFLNAHSAMAPSWVFTMPLICFQRRRAQILTHSSPFLPQPSAGRTTFFFPRPPFRFFGPSKDLIFFPFLTLQL